MDDLSPFRKTILRAIKEMRHPNWYEIAWNYFPETWAKRSSRGGLIAQIDRAGYRMEEMGLIWRTPPKDQFDAARYHLRKPT